VNGPVEMNQVFRSLDHPFASDGRPKRQTVEHCDRILTLAVHEQGALSRSQILI
jgi:hypothetical protein